MSTSSEQNPMRDENEVDKHRDCEHHTTFERGIRVFCKKCGVVVPKSGVTVYKSEDYVYKADFDPMAVWNGLLRRPLQKPKDLSQKYLNHRKRLISWMLKVTKALNLSCYVAHLATFYVDFLLSKCPEYDTSVNIYGAAALLLASKAIEKDERVPQNQSVVNITGSAFTAKQLSAAELTLSEALEWHCQQGTVVELVETLFSFGILYSSDEYTGDELHFTLQSVSSPENAKKAPSLYVEASDPQFVAQLYAEKVYGKNPQSDTLVAQDSLDHHDTTLTTEPSLNHHSYSTCSPKEKLSSLQRIAYSLCELMIVEHEFLEYSDDVLAAAVIAFSRKVGKVTPIWNNELEISTGKSFEQISEVFERFKVLFENIIENYVPSVPFKNTHITPPALHYYNAVDYLADLETPAPPMIAQPPLPQGVPQIQGYPGYQPNGFPPGFSQHFAGNMNMNNFMWNGIPDPLITNGIVDPYMMMGFNNQMQNPASNGNFGQNIQPKYSAMYPQGQTNSVPAGFHQKWGAEDNASYSNINTNFPNVMFQNVNTKLQSCTNFANNSSNPNILILQNI